MRTPLRLIPLFIVVTAGLTLAMVVGLAAGGEAGLAPTGVITVTTTLPEVAADGQCSLIEAIDNANADAASHADCAAGSGADTIELASGASYTLTAVHNNSGGNNGLPVISSTITVNGHVATIARSTAVTVTFRFFNVATAGQLTLNEITFRNGSGGTGGAIVNSGVLMVNDSDFRNNNGGFGAAIFNNPLTSTLTINNSVFEANTTGGGGAIYNQGVMTVNDSLVVNNNTGGNGAGIINNRTATINGSTIQGNTSGFIGGGLFNNGEGAVLTINHSMVMSNTTGQGGGGIGNLAGNDGSVTVIVNHSLISGNSSTGSDPTSAVGGGIVNGLYAGNDNALAIVEVYDSTIEGNTARNGGGLANVVPGVVTSATVQMVINRSTINGNTADGSGLQFGNGGGILNVDSEVTVVNSTVSGNAANGSGTLSGVGGGLANAGFNAPAVTGLTNATIASNTAVADGSGLANGNLGGGATITSENTVVAGNDCFNTAGTYTSLDHNLEEGDSCNFDQANDQTNIDPMIGPLADNGGPTETHALLEGSPAIDEAANATCAAEPVGGVDQRGAPRPQGSVCDIGAYERLNPADLALQKSGPAEATTGEVMTYTLTVTNTGVDAAALVILTDTLPGGTNFVSASAGCTYEIGTHQVICEVGNVAAGAAEVVTIVATAPETAAHITNTATATALSPDPVMGNNMASADTHVESGLLYIYLPLVVNK
jgi:uncharacterized repeat protein (TIGR01451 family)